MGLREGPHGEQPVFPPPLPGRPSIARAMAAQPGGGKKPFHIISPVLESLALSRAAGTKVYMKLENVQPTGSFKIRGIGHLCQEVSVGRALLVPLWGHGRGTQLSPSLLPSCLSGCQEGLSPLRLLLR